MFFPSLCAHLLDGFTRTTIFSLFFFFFWINKNVRRRSSQKKQKKKKERKLTNICLSFLSMKFNLKCNIVLDYFFFSSLSRAHTPILIQNRSNENAKLLLKLNTSHAYIYICKND